MDDTFQDYLERAEAQGIVDFSIRVIRNPDAMLDFYIHPLERDGATGDFTGINRWLALVRFAESKATGARVISL
jgi:hypothetical protein